MEMIVYTGPLTGPVFVPAFGLRATPGEPVEVTPEQAEALVGAGWERVPTTADGDASGEPTDEDDSAGDESTEDEEQ